MGRIQRMAYRSVEKLHFKEIPLATPNPKEGAQMKKLILPLIAMVLFFPLRSESITHSITKGYSSGGVELDLSEPAGSIYRPGESVSFTFQTKEDAYVILFDIDTDGFVHLIYPDNGRLDKPAAAGRKYTVPENRGNSLFVDGETGMEFVFALAVDDRNYIDETELEFMAENESLPLDRRFRIDGDPFLAANMIAGELVRGISHRPGVSLAYTYFHINERVPYPRYLCAECHDKSNQPYTEACPEYEFSPNFGLASNLTYPLGRGFNIVQAEADTGESDDEDNTTQVIVDFWPYRTEVIQHPQLWIRSVYYDPWWYYDPFFYDPWDYWAVYYPYHPDYYYPRYHFWNSWSWNWGWGWGHPRHGYWAGFWGGRFWNDRGFYGFRDHYGRPGDRREIRPWNPKQRYKGPLTEALTMASGRDPEMRISTIKSPTNRLRVSSPIKNTGRNKLPTDKAGSSYLKRPEVRRDRTHIYSLPGEKALRNSRIQTPGTRPNPDRKDPGAIRRQPPERREPARPIRDGQRLRTPTRRNGEDSKAGKGNKEGRSVQPRSRKNSGDSGKAKDDGASRRTWEPRSSSSNSHSSSRSESSKRVYRPAGRSSSSSKSTPARSSGGGKSRGSSKSSGSGKSKK
jgi:hypothetical protein